MPARRSVAVFCGSRPGSKPDFVQAARDLGHGLAQDNIRLVYGGGRVGLMGAVADAVLEGGGDVLGVIPEFLTRLEVAHTGAALTITDSMHSRKQLMFAEADAFVIMPGGLGTMDETFEIITWRQLGLHDKPILLCDVAGSARAVRAVIETSIDLGFAPTASRNLYEFIDGVPALLERLRSLSPSAPVAPDRL